MESYGKREKYNAALGTIRAEMMAMVALELVVKKAPRKVGQTCLGSAKIRVTAGKGIGMMHVMVFGVIIRAIEVISMSGVTALVTVVVAVGRIT